MSLIRKPSALNVKQTLTALVYGQPGCGKSTLALSAPNAILFDFDGGVNRINGAHQVDTVQVTSWEEAQDALFEVKALPDYDTIVVDTVGKMLGYMDEYIKRTNPKMTNRDGTLALKGYGLRKQMFLSFMRELAVMGKNIIFVAHEIEQKRGDDTIIRPEVGGSSSNDLIKEMDLVGYMEVFNNKRTIIFDPADKCYTKNTCNMHGVIEIPVVVDEHGVAVGQNNFFGRIIDAYRNRQLNNLKQTQAFEDLMELIGENIEGIEDAEQANTVLGWILGLDHIYNSKVKASKLLADKTKSLGLTFNKMSNKYEQAG